jgi:hypothetical protein
MRKTLMVLGMIAVGIALVAAGCGGDDDDDTAATTTTGATGAAGGAPLSKEQFIAEANAICKQGTKELDQAAGEVFGKGQEPSQEEQERFITETALPNTQAQIDAIRALTPPEGDEEQITAILDEAQQELDELEQDPGSLTEGGEDPFADVNRMLREYGITTCAE